MPVELSAFGNDRREKKGDGGCAAVVDIGRNTESNVGL